MKEEISKGKTETNRSIFESPFNDSLQIRLSATQIPHLVGLDDSPRCVLIAVSYDVLTMTSWSLKRRS